MKLRPGYRLAVAAKFHLEAEWASRLSLGRGVEEIEGSFFPLGPWRPPDADELACLAGGPGEDPDAVLLFRFPDHLHAAWWDTLDAAAGAGGEVRGFDAFAARVRDFLTFKGLGTTGRVEMEVVVTAPGQRTIRSDPATRRPAGLGPTVAPWAAHPTPGRPAGAPAPRLHAVVNLGDEPTGVAFVNLAPGDLAAEVARHRPDAPAATILGELAAQFLRARPDYPPVRLRLGPGEAVRLPACGLTLDGDPAGKQEPDVLLLVSAGS